MYNVLLVEADDLALRERGDELLIDGYEVLVAQTGAAARLRLAEAPDALVIGELEKPGASLALVRELRAGEVAHSDPRIPVLALGADSDHTAVRLYEAGADIALQSEASPLLLKGALEAALARGGGNGQGRRLLRCGALLVDCDARVASVGDHSVELTRIEFDLLQTLAAEPHRTFRKDELTRAVWDYDPVVAGASRTLDSHANRLRQKLQGAGAEALVQNVRGVGYRLTR
jgi:DNA-binding response OmpR family regulator